MLFPVLRCKSWANKYVNEDRPWLPLVDPGFSWGVPTPKVGVLTYYFAIFFAENCMKMKEFGPWGELRIPVTPLNPPMA